MFKLMLTALLLISFAGCNLDYTLSDDGKVVHSGLTGIDYPISALVASVTSNYTEEEIANALGDNKGSIERASRYVTGTYTPQDIIDSVGVLIQLQINKK